MDIDRVLMRIFVTRSFLSYNFFNLFPSFFRLHATEKLMLWERFRSVFILFFEIWWETKTWNWSYVNIQDVLSWVRWSLRSERFWYRKMFLKKKYMKILYSAIARRSNSFRNVLAAIKAKLKLNTWECDISKNERVEFECQDMNLDLFLVENRLESKLSSNWILWKFHLLVNDVSSCL